MAKPSLNYYQAVHVGKVKTDVIQFTAIQSAIDAITDNAAGKRYAVYVHPGTYTEKITMEDYIDLIAEGGREETIISFTATAHDEATLTGENSIVKGFTIISDGNAGAWRARVVNASVAGFEIEDCILTPQNTAAAAIALNASASCDIRDSVVDSASAAATGALFTTAGQTYNVSRTTFDATTDAIQVTTTPTLNLIDCTVSDNFNQDGGTVNVQRCQMEATDFGTDTCTFSAELTRFTAALATAGAFAHTITCIKCSFSGQNFNNAATGATSIDLRECGGIGTLTNAGVAGTLDIWDSDIEIINTSQGTVTALGGRIASCAASTGVGFVWWENANQLKVIENMRIADALGVAVAGDIIFIEAGTYNESNLTLLASVNIIGVDEGTAIIRANSAANAILNCAVACTIANLTVHNQNAGAPAIAVTAGTLTIDNCTIQGTGAGDAITMIAGAVNLYDSWVPTGDIDLSTSACILSLYNSYLVNDPIDTAGAFAHNIYAINCDFGSRNINSAATGATTLDMRGCSYVGTITNAGTGAFSIRDSGIADIQVTNAAGSAVVNGGYVGTCGSSVGSVVWWQDANKLVVLSGMKVAHALAVAASGDAIHIARGTFTESNLTAVNGVDIVGEGSDISIIETTDNANPIITVGNNVACAFREVRISNLGTGTTVAVSAVAAAATLVVESCELRGNAGASIVTLTTAGAGAPQLTSRSSIFRTGATAIAVTGAIVANVLVRNSLFATCTLVFSTTGANHTFSLDYCDFSAGGVTLTANVPVVTLSNCENIGTFTHNTASTVNFNHCHVSGAYTTGAVVAIVTAYATTFANFTHAGTGAITLDNCRLGDVANNSTATMTIRDSSMGALTQAAAAGTINVYNSSMGNITTGAAGTIRLEGGCRFADIAANAGVLTWKVDPNHIKVVAGTANMKVADALTLAAAGDVIQIMPGTFAESNLTLKASVDLVGTDPDQCLIVAIGAAVPILNAGVTCSISNLTIGNGDATGTAITVTANSLTIRNCYVYGTGIGDAIAMTGGTLYAYDSRVGAGDIDLSTAACNLYMYRCQITTDPIDTAGAFAHNLRFEQCDFNTRNIASAATGATAMTLLGCSTVGTITHAGTGACSIRDSDVTAINNTATGTFTIYGGYVNSITRAAVSVVWWQDEHTLKVLPSGTATDTMIGYAITASAAGDVIMIAPGTYDEVATCKAGVDLKGIGPKGGVIIQQTDANIVTLANNVDIDNLTVRLVTPTVARYLVLDNGIACTCRLTNLVLEITTPGNLAHQLFRFAGAGNYTIEHCYSSIDFGVNNPVAVSIINTGAAATIRVFGNDFSMTSTGAFHIYSDLAGTWTGGQNRWAGACAMFSVTLATITLDGDTMVASAASTVAAAATVLMRETPLKYHVYLGMDIQDALTAGAGGEVVIHAGAYAPIANLTVSANTLVRGEGFATIITATGAAITNAMILNGNNIHVKDLKIVLAAGAGAGGTRPNCIYATGRTLLWLESLWLIGDTTVADDGSDIRQDGICFVTCTECKVLGCRPEDSKRHGIYLGSTSSNNTITGNTCQGNTGNGILILSANENNIVVGNICQGNTGSGIYISASGYNTITGNTFQGNTGNGITLVGPNPSNTITGNTCQGNTGYGMRVVSSPDNTITGNTCQGNGNHGISIYRSSYCVITGNLCDGNTGAATDGINITGDGTTNSDYNTITGNVCTGNGDDGIEIAGGANANKNIVVGNQLLGNTGTPLVDGGTATEIGHNITA